MNSIHILTVSVAMLVTSCGRQAGVPSGGQSSGQPSGQSVFAEQPKTVRAYVPEMNNMEMLSMKQMPGWRFLAGTQWMGNSYCVSIRGVNDNLTAGMFIDGNRGYTQMPMMQSGTSDGKTVYLNCMSAPDYLDYVFHRQFPYAKGARRVMLKTIDRYPEEDRRKFENYRVQLYNTAVQGYRQMPGGENNIVRQTAIDCASAEYQWVQDGDTIVHSMEAVVSAMYADYRSPYLNYSFVVWQQNALTTLTFPSKNRKRIEDDFKQTKASVKVNDAYLTALNNIVMQGMQREGEIQRRQQIEMAQAEIRHQQRMAKMMQETNEYIANVQREAIASRQAAQDRSFRRWTDAIIGVNRFIGSDGKVVQVPVSAGSHAWQSADGGTIITSDSYLFNAVDNLYDKDGRLQEFREMQMLR